MIGIVLSIFDSCIGPKILLKYPNSIEDVKIDHIPNLMDVFEKGFIVYEFGDLKTANYVFEVKNPIARGYKDTLMFSVISHHEQYQLNLSSFKDIIEYFVKEITKIPTLYKGIHHKDIPGGTKEYKKMKKLLHSFYNFLPNEDVIFEPKLKRKLTFELSTLGKSDIISQLSRLKSINLTLP
jgi:hypothetical protein